MLCRLFVFLLIAATAISLQAAQFIELGTNARALGMGNAFVSVVDNGDSLFYNPAGLAKNTGYYWTVVDLGLGVSGVDVFTQLAQLKDPDDFPAALDQLYGGPAWIGGTGKTAFTLSGIAISAYNATDANLFLTNPTNPDLTINAVNDYGIAVGFGFSVVPFLQTGITVKRINRNGARVTFDSSVIGALNPDSIFGDSLLKDGVGYSLDVGMNFTIDAPISPTLSLVVKNLGGTSFKAEEGSEPPPSDPQEVILGASLLLDTPLISLLPTIDIKHALDEGEPLGKKLHIGVELDLPIVDVRAGLHQGYYSLGVGVSLGVIRVDAATWGVELGEYPGQLEDRRYLIQMTAEIGFDPGFGLSFGGSSGSGGGGSGGSSRKRLKQRR